MDEMPVPHALSRDQWSRPRRTADGSRRRGAARAGGAVGGAGGGLVERLRMVPVVGALALAGLLLAGAMGLATLADEGPAARGVEAGTFLDQAAAAGTGAAANVTEPPTSTPRDQWGKGAVPHLYQIDPAWADAPYAGDTVGTSGCGPTSLAMVYVALTGKTDRDPAAMAAFSEQNGYVEGGLTAWRLMSDGARQLGLKSREVSASAAAVRAELAAGRPVICSVGPGDFTTEGHFIVLTAVDENGGIVVHDPNSEPRSHQSWDADRIISQCRNLWSFERA